jgi:hypothetical protein
MRERFELAVKIVGLVLVCGGILLTVGAVFRLLLEPDWSSYVEAGLPESVRDSAAPWVARLEEAWSAGWKRILADMAVQGVLPIALGLYLLCSGRLAVQWAYPNDGAKARGAPSGTLGRGDSGPPSPAPADPSSEADERRYAPPGMYDD